MGKMGKGKASFAVFGFIIALVALQGCANIPKWKLHPGQQYETRLTGTSNGDFFKERRAKVVGINFEDIKPGMAIAYWKPGENKRVVHFVREVGKDALTTRGLANPVNDDPVFKEQVIGRALRLGEDDTYFDDWRKPE